MARDNCVEHPVCEQKLGALKIVRQFLVAGLSRDASARESDQRSGLRKIQIAEHRKRGG